ncbi:MAG: tetratricopeptide repeat protein [Acidobacteria bacterium]|nr:tetratricopeptide repeat protein [Acidobacteriota bacterium]
MYQRQWVARTVFLLVSIVGMWVLLTPDNALVRFFSAKISDKDSPVIVGPYPAESDFRILKKHGVTLVVSLLDPRLPHERVLLERERKLAEKHGMRWMNYPMISIFGKEVGADYEANAAAAADAIVHEAGKVYLHCYLGLHRVKTVRELLEARGKPTGTYLVRKGERNERALTLDAAQADFDAGRFEDAIVKLKTIQPQDFPVQMLSAWSHYRLGNVDEARALFEGVLRTSPTNNEARNGLGYCALRQNDLAAAEQQFTAVLKDVPRDPTAHSGLAMVYYRQKRLEPAAEHLEAALRSGRKNAEAQELLDRVRAQQAERKKAALQARAPGK